MDWVRLQCFSKLPTVHDRHHEIEEDQGWSRHLQEKLESFLTIRGCINAVSFPLQRVFENRANIQFVFDQQNVSGNGLSLPFSLPGFTFSLLSKFYRRSSAEIWAETGSSFLDSWRSGGHSRN